MNKPVICIVSSEEYIEKGQYKKTVHSVNEDYVNMINNNGGIPVIIPYTASISKNKLIDECDGLLLIGGKDISKNAYTNTKIIDKRDKFEIEIYNQFRTVEKPILGICRGMQLINVAEGGTLSNIKETSISHYIENDGWINYHDINIDDNTLLKEIIGANKYTVSSVHHQKINKLASSLKISAKSPDGVIEAVETSDSSFIMGFQGHIEKCLKNYVKYNDVIKKFIEECSNGKR